MKTLIQIFAVARTEFRFGLRRGAPVVVTALIGLVVAAGILITPLLNLEGWAPPPADVDALAQERLSEAGITVAEYLDLGRHLFEDMTAFSTPMGWTLIYLALLLLPVAAAGAVPADRQYGALEILRSTPLSAWAYLGGKMAGLLGVVLLVSLGPALVFFVILEAVILRFLHTGLTANLAVFYVKLGLMDGLPILVWSTGIGLLAGIFFRSRRSAILPGLAAGFISLFIWVRIFVTHRAAYQSFDPAAYFVFQGYRSQAQPTLDKLIAALPTGPEYGILGVEAATIGIEPVLWMYGFILVSLTTLSALARLWLYWKENF